jgi:hypothetical protein
MAKKDPDVNNTGKNGSGAFGSLAGYVFGKNQANNKMAMTTPVLMSENGNKMSFVMVPETRWLPLHYLFSQ